MPFSFVKIQSWTFFRTICSNFYFYWYLWRQRWWIGTHFATFFSSKFDHQPFSELFVPVFTAISGTSEIAFKKCHLWRTAVEKHITNVNKEIVTFYVVFCENGRNWRQRWWIGTHFAIFFCQNCGEIGASRLRHSGSLLDFSNGSVA